MIALISRIFNPYVFIAILGIVGLIIAMASSKEKERKESEGRAAAEIAKQFGDKNITLFVFQENRWKTGAYILIEFNNRYDDVYELRSHRNNYIVGKWYNEKGLKDVKIRWDHIQKLLPNYVPQMDSVISYEEYANRI